jgi:hypothetical protein
MEKQVDKKHYNFERYCYPERWASYYQQIKEIVRVEPKTVLEIGAGDYTVKSYVEKYTGCTYKTVDIADDLHPDIIAPIHDIPVPNKSFDVVCAFEVLEHIPFDHVPQALAELKRISSKYVLISVPHFGPMMHIDFKLPFIPRIQFHWKIPYHPKHSFNGQHYWELGKKGYSVDLLKKIITEKGFTIENDYIPYDSEYHHFFILKS